MRCKYLKIRFEILNSSAGVNQQLEKSNQIMKEILSMIRKRGIITFDEMHKAFDPMKELNMPYGAPARPNVQESRLLNKIVSLARKAKDGEKPLLDIAHTALQTPEQFEKMKMLTIEELIKEPRWSSLEIKEYLSGTREDVPELLDDPGNRDFAKLVILARQMLAGDWLKERLSANVDEHHGIPNAGFPRVSIPFVANMKPAHGSEFSDRYVMTANTLIAYLSTGLNDEQTIELIYALRKKTYAEKERMSEENMNSLIIETETYKKFNEGTGLDLFRLDVEKKEDLAKLQKALLTEKPEAIEILQGSRRLRKLDYQQKIAMALSSATVKAIETTLGKVYNPGESPPIKDLLLYANIKEASGQKPENMLYCLQKMENIIQQHIIDKLFKMDEQAEQQLFTQCAYLFEKNVAVDLYKEYAHKREQMPISDYLEAIKGSLLGPLKDVLGESDVKELEKTIDVEVLTEETMKGLEPKIDVSHSFASQKKPTAATNANSTVSRVQMNVQERISEKLQVTQQEDMSQYLNQVESQTQNRGWGGEREPDKTVNAEFFFSDEMGKTTPDHKITGSIDENKICWSLNNAITSERSGFSDLKFPHPCQLEDELITTYNAVLVSYSRYDITTPQRKKPWPLLVICDEAPDGTKNWKVILCSMQEGVDFRDYITKEQGTPPAGRTIWLVRGNGKLIAGHSKLDIEGDKKLSLLMTQAMFFSGDFVSLSYKPWRERLEAWLDSQTPEQQKAWVKFFEEEILRGTPPGYKASRLHTYLHSLLEESKTYTSS